jgi:hypothetical protein
MPVITVGLFAAAIVIFLVAFAITRISGDDDDGGLTPADRLAVQQTNTSLARTAAAEGNQTPRPTSETTPNGEETPNSGQTPGAATPTTPSNGGATTYEVQGGDFCGTIADAHGITLERFYEQNPDIDANCSNLFVGQIVNVAP